jgi:hypothetical protein
MAATLGVDHASVPSEEEPALSSVGSAHVGRSDMTVLRIEPHFGQIGEDLVVGRALVDREEARDVLEEDVRRSDLTENPSKSRPEPALVVDALSPSGNGGGLAGEPGNEEIHDATPGSSQEAEEIRPHRARIHASRFHFLDQDADGVGFDLTSNDRSSVSKSELEGVVPEAEAAAEAADLDRSIPRLFGTIHTYASVSASLSVKPRSVPLNSSSSISASRAS